MTTDTWSLVMPLDLQESLWAHLFPGDDDEHGAVVLAGVTKTPDGPRLLARELILAVDGIDYVPGTRGYRALTSDFVQRAALAARDRHLAYLAVHCHGGTNHVDFSEVDLASHERGYPALRDITGQPVGALVVARHAVAGDLWLPDGRRATLSRTSVPGRVITRLTPTPELAPPEAAPGWDRQARLFGDAGQARLARTSVAIVGLGGLGSLLAEYLGRLGLGRLVLVDPDRADITNLPRLVGARRIDAPAGLATTWRGRLTAGRATSKVRLAARNIRRANRAAIVECYRTSVDDPAAAAAVAGTDFIFLAGDSHTARHVVNAIVQQYLIPGVQAGVKIRVAADGTVEDIHVPVRPLVPGRACLWCGGLIDATKLALESLPDAERKAVQYVPDVPSASVITLNGLAAAEAATYFLFALTGLNEPDGAGNALLRFPRQLRMTSQVLNAEPDCKWCTDATGSHLARGDNMPLPVRLTGR
ncbi:MAG TPA: ThiF family adenylyltransferase [Propionicimonas sp.]|jgi:hypothetical protein